MFKFFQKLQKQIEYNKSEEINNDNLLASISYLIKKDTNNNTIIDIQINDYDEESIEALGTLLLTLSNDNCFLETTNIIRSLLIKDDRPDILIKLFSKIHNQFKEKLNNIQTSRLIDKPCIKPSEMFGK